MSFDFNSPNFQNSYIDESHLASATADAMRRVFNWMGLGLLITALVAWFTAPFVPSILEQMPFLFMGLFLVEIGMVFWLSRAISRLSPAGALTGFLAYAAVNGITMSMIFIVYDLGDVAITFGVTTLLFFVMALIGYTTGTDLSRWGSLLFMGLIGFLIASVVNWFLQSPVLYWIITYAGVAIFVGLTAYDTQKIKQMTAVALMSGNEDDVKRVGVRGALSLYLDFINLFLLLLRILGRRR